MGFSAVFFAGAAFFAAGFSAVFFAGAAFFAAGFSVVFFTAAAFFVAEAVSFLSAFFISAFFTSAFLTSGLESVSFFSESSFFLVTSCSRSIALVSSRLISPPENSSAKVCLTGSGLTDEEGFFSSNKGFSSSGAIFRRAVALRFIMLFSFLALLFFLSAISHLFPGSGSPRPFVYCDTGI